MRRKLLAVLREPVYEQVLKRGSLFRSTQTRKDIEIYQLNKVNEVWRDAWTNVPFFREWKSEMGLPETVSSLSDFDKWPIVKKQDLQRSAARGGLLREGQKPMRYLRTGGSTGEPLCFGTWSDGGFAASSQWFGRCSNGVLPGSRTFLLWGHEHLYGHGYRQYLNAGIRRMKDRLSSICRVSAYDLSPDAMSKAFVKYNAFRPECVIGFSAAVLAFSRVNQRNGRRVGQSPCAVVCTAGPLSIVEKQEIESFFGAGICMEYGSVECGIIGYTEPPSQEYKVFWDSHLVQTEIDEFGQSKAVITRLTSCYVPLIRYDIGDYVLVTDCTQSSHLTLLDVRGRPSDIVTLKDGTAFFGALIGDCVKQVDGILGNQLVVCADGLRLLLTASRDLTTADYALIRRRLNVVVPQLRNVKVTVACVASLLITAGGKSPLVVQRESECS